MLEIKNSTKVFVYCPANHTTGGAELLHQLVDKLNNYFLDAYIVYSQNDAKIPNEYSNYNIKIANYIEDAEQNIIVFYEAMFDKAFEIKKAQILLWWLSVDNFYYCSSNFLSIFDYFKWNPKYGITLLIRRLGTFIIKQRNIFNKKSLNDIKKLDAVNCYQSEYAQNFLINNGFNRLAPLTDYINLELINLDCNFKRENIVLYNPKKGFRFTKKLIKSSPELKWVPLIGMNRQELLNTFLTSKLYIDFGYHPGKDRIPREAAINGCCVITGIEGSARFFEDVSIPNYYKIDIDNTNISTIIERIDEILNNYESHNTDFDFYIKKIKREQTEFDYQVRNLFQI